MTFKKHDKVLVIKGSRIYPDIPASSFGFSKVGFIDTAFIGQTYKIRLDCGVFIWALAKEIKLYKDLSPLEQAIYGIE